MTDQSEPTELRVYARAIVDEAWNEATESTTVPATEWADRVIDRVPEPSIYTSIKRELARLRRFTEGDIAQEMASNAWWAGFRAGALFAFAIGLIIAIVLASSGCYMAHEPARPIAYASSVEVQLYDDGCVADAEGQWWIGAAYDGETMMLGDEVLSDPMGCAFAGDAPGACEFWPAGSAMWESATIEQSEGALRIEIDGRIGPQPDARGHCMLFKYRLNGAGPT